MAKNSERNEALEIIKSGRAAMLTVDGVRKIFTLENVDELPSEVDLAIGNPEATSEAIDNIEEQIKVLQEAQKRLTATKKEQDADAKVIEKKEAASAPAKEEEEAPKASAKKEESK